MGADEFMVRSRGKTPEEAFRAAVEDAAYEYGHGGYSGTIAEKQKFTLISVPADTRAIDFARKLLADNDPRVDDKWGPAGCVLLERLNDGMGVWLFFFGWASS